ncbi:hypothetical protein ABIB34_002455 [Rhodococcus sp. UYP5]
MKPFVTQWYVGQPLLVDESPWLRVVAMLDKRVQ